MRQYKKMTFKEAFKAYLDLMHDKNLSIWQKFWGYVIVPIILIMVMLYHFIISVIDSVFRIYLGKRLRWEDISGVGDLSCNRCGHTEEITGFSHGSYSCSLGRQCPHCGKIFEEYNSSEHYHTFGKRTEDLYCPECGKLVSKKEDFTIHDNSVIRCPKCKSKNVNYRMRYIT